MQRQLLPVNEIFRTIQGEATHAGRPSVFVRLQGCPVGCAWCDTKHTWRTDPGMSVPIHTILAKNSEPSPMFANQYAEQIANDVLLLHANHVVITGGEPCLYDLRSLTAGLLSFGRTVQIETSGTSEVLVAAGAWVTVSPKLGKQGGFPVLESAMRRADEIKLPVAIQRDVDEYDAFLTTLPYDARPDARGIATWLQPVWQARHGQHLCVETATARGWRVSLQTHKHAGIR